MACATSASAPARWAVNCKSSGAPKVGCSSRCGCPWNKDLTGLLFPSRVHMTVNPFRLFPRPNVPSISGHLTSVSARRVCDTDQQMFGTEDVSMYKKILVPLDGSKLSEAVLPHALGLTEADSAEIVL